MSGFLGIVRTDGSTVEQKLLDHIAQSLQFRGPDGCQTWAKNNVGFCFTFLDTETLHQTQRQPAHFCDRYSLLGDVRLDARKELVSQLQRAGQRATEEASDAELILLSWMVWGEAALSKFLGDFSFGLWDAEQQSLWCARDFSGARPFFYAKTPGVFGFSNTLQSLRLIPEISSELEDLFVRDFLLEGVSRDHERTVWRDIRRLPAGHCSRFTRGQLEVRRFVQLPVEEPLRFKEPSDYLENFREIVQLAVADRLPEGKTAFSLSGGLDSATVCAAAARITSQRGASQNLKAFTISWRPLMDDPEPAFARLTAQHLGLSHEVLEESHILPYDGVEAESTPEPTSEVFFARDFRLFRAISTHSRVMLSGDGGDNVLDGKAWPYLQYLRKRGEWGTIAGSFGGYFLAHGQVPPLRAGLRSRFRPTLRLQEALQGIPPWLNDGFSSRLRAQADRDGEPPKASLPVHPVHPSAYAGLHSGFWASVLQEEDAGWTGINLETRAPFLDLRVLQFLLRVPPVPWCMNKELTRRTMRGFLPAKVLKRRKTPLLRDPLQACKQNGWRPRLEKKPPQRIHEFVKWSSWLATLQSPTGWFTWENSYPISFALWLESH